MDCNQCTTFIHLPICAACEVGIRMRVLLTSGDWHHLKDRFDRDTGNTSTTLFRPHCSTIAPVQGTGAQNRALVSKLLHHGGLLR